MARRIKEIPISDINKWIRKNEIVWELYNQRGELAVHYINWDFEHLHYKPDKKYKYFVLTDLED